MRPISTRTPLAIALALALPFALSACSPSSGDRATTEATTEAETARLNAWFDTQYEELLQFSPMSLTSLGRKELYDRFDDVSEAGMQRRLEWLEASVAEMESRFNHDALDEDAKLSWELWKRQATQAREAMPYLAHAYPFNQMRGMYGALPTFLIAQHRVDDEQDMLAYIARLGAIAGVLDEQIAQAEASAGQGILPPRFALEGTIYQSRNLIAGAPFDDGQDSALWADANTRIDALVESGALSAERADALKAQARTALLEQVQPTYERVIAWAEGQWPNAAVNPAGVSTRHPGGAEYYAWQLRQNTTTAMTADEIHQLGLDEVARLRGEMEALKDRVGFEGDLPAFFHFINTDPQFKYPDTDEGRQAYIDDATAAIDNIRQHLPAFFGLIPKAELEVRRVEAFREQPGAAQHYQPGAPDGSRPGVYYAHLSDMNAMPRTEMEVIAYHEGLPGHHMQISIAQELDNIPQFRTRYFSTAYVEGWALYTEALATEIPGTYQDPYSEYGRLTSEMWRAVRLVVDTGLHAMGWTQQQAVDYFRQNASVPLTAIESEIQRYLVMPGQATSYKIGMLKIQELRHRAETELGDRFDIRDFHDLILGGGAMPLDLLEQRVERWIAGHKAG